MKPKIMDQEYSNRELDGKFDHIIIELAAIKVQTTKHNGRMSNMERNMLIFATALAVLLITNSSQLIAIFKIII